MKRGWSSRGRTILRQPARRWAAQFTDCSRACADPSPDSVVLIRADEEGVLLIGQPSHAWISGQLARAWGNLRFGAVEPYEEVCLGAEQHDIGMAISDLAPTLNAETGLPHSFLEMTLGTHLQLWSAGPRQL